MIIDNDITQIDDFLFPKDILCQYLRNGFDFLYQGYLIVLKTKEYSLSEDSSRLENKIRDDIEREAKPLLLKIALSNRDNRFFKFSFYNEPVDASKEADIKKFDIALDYDSAPYMHNIIIECKRLKKNAKNAAYIEKGVERFETNRYGYGLPIAGMIGFIEKGNQNDIIKDLTRRIDKKITISQSLQKLDNTSNVFHKSYKNDIYNSIHQRVDDLDDIEIFHLTMDFTSIIHS